MRKVIGIGETVFDIVFKNGQPIAGVPGGSTFNSIVSLGRCGLDAAILTEFGDDKVGGIVRDFMVQNGVNPSYANHLPCKTPVSMAFLDENNEAQYSFYRDAAVERPEFKLPDIQKDDIIIFGSFYALNPDVRSEVSRFLEYARSSGALLYYDVNFRPSHKKSLGEIGESLLENYEYADFIRGSKDDFITLYGIEDADLVYSEKIAPHCSHFIFTSGARPVQVRDTGGFKKAYSVPPVKTVSTIGAGDNFNAGFIYGLVKQGITKEILTTGLSEAQWDSLIGTAHQFSSDCCRSLFNYVSPEFGLSHRL